MSKGFVIEESGTAPKVAGSSLAELIHSTVDQLLENIKGTGAAGTSGTFAFPCNTPGHEHLIRVSIFETTDEAECVHCAGTGIEGSTERKAGH